MSKSVPTLLIDGDEFLYKATVVNEVETQWDDELFTLHSDLGQSKVTLVAMLDSVMRDLKTPNLIFCLSSSDNFRKSVLPSYKEARKATRKPIGYSELKAWAITQYPTVCWPGLEADDVMGILATQPKDSTNEPDLIIVSQDKDMKTVPCTLYRQKELDVISEEEADLFFHTQTLMGDITDGYKGCPGIGDKTAAKALANADRTPWENIVATYEKAGLSEADALIQARCARILRATEYDIQEKQILLWNPPKKVSND